MPEVVCKFAEFELDRGVYQLRRKGRPVTLERIPLDLLFLLADRRGQLVTREEIRERIWGKDVFLDVESAINTAVRKIRLALRDDADSPRFIETVPAKGYRFLASMREMRSTGEASTASRPQKTSLVGRARELSVVRADLDRAVSGSGRLVLISGEPGIGKSRLCEELAALARTNGMAILSGRCLDDEQAVPFLPFVEMLEGIANRASGADAMRTTFGEQGGELTRLLPRLRTLVPDFSPRTDLGPAEARRYLFNSFCDFVSRIAREQSALLLLEDLHWGDDSTLSLLEHLIQHLRDMPVLVVGTYRDSDLDMTPGLAKYLENLLRERLGARVRLKRLLPDEVAGMLRGLSGQDPPPDVTETIFGESQGNPFLIEELFRYLEEEGLLYDSAGKFRAWLTVGERDAPPSVRLVVTRRLDRLNPETRRMLAIAAVIGRSFDFDLLRGSTEGDTDAVLACVEEAEKAGLISPVAASANLRFEFSHELTRQAVIAGLSAARRQSLHQKVAEAIERTYQPALEDHFAALAQHHRHGGNRAAAIDYLHRAGKQAVDVAMYAEAQSYFAAALEETGAMPASPERDALELRVRSSFGQAIAASKGYAASEVLEMASRARALAERTGDLAEVVQQLWMEAGFAEVRGDLVAAASLSDKLLAAAQRHGNSISLAMAHTMQLENRFYRGDFVGSEEHFERGRAFFETPGFTKIQYGPAAAFGGGSWNAWIIGRSGVARDRMQRAREQTLLDPYDVGVRSQMVALLHVFLGEFGEAESVAAKALLYAEQRGFNELAMWHRIVLGMARAKLGHPGEGVNLLRKAVVEMRTNGHPCTMTHALTWLAEAQALAGAVDDALKTIGDALAANPEELYFRPETNRVRGELRLMGGDRAAAEADFREAIATAQRMRAKSWELRATTSLAHLLRDTERGDEARTILSRIYAWFSEGFDTADLRAAKALLDELGK